MTVPEGVDGTGASSEVELEVHLKAGWLGSPGMEDGLGWTEGPEVEVGTDGVEGRGGMGS